MNDFSEIESELKKLRPMSPSPGLLSRIEHAILDAESESESSSNVIRPDRFRFNWISVGLGLAAAAALLMVAYIEVDRRRPAREMPSVAQVAPVPVAPSITASGQLIPAQLTQVVYQTRDEGLHFPDGSGQPMRRWRSQKRETLQWRNPATGASLRVSYPSEEVELIPVHGQ